MRSLSLQVSSHNESVCEPCGAEGGLPQRSETLAAVVRSGALAVIRPDTLKAGSLYGHNIIGYEMPEERSVDINTPFDMKIAQMVYGEGLHI